YCRQSRIACGAGYCEHCASAGGGAVTLASAPRADEPPTCAPRFGLSATPPMRALRDPSVGSRGRLRSDPTPPVPSAARPLAASMAPPLFCDTDGLRPSLRDLEPSSRIAKRRPKAVCVIKKWGVTSERASARAADGTGDFGSKR